MKMTPQIPNMYTALYVRKPWVSSNKFKDEKHYRQWRNDILTIKNHLLAINKHRVDGIKAPYKKLPVKSSLEWLFKVNLFIEKWGEHFVPPDIKAAVNKIEQRESQKITEWKRPPDDYIWPFSTFPSEDFWEFLMYFVNSY